MFNPSLEQPFQMFSLVHFIVLSFSLLLIALLLLTRNYFKQPRAKTIFRISLGLSLLIVESIFVIWSTRMGGFVLKEFIPLGLCALTARLTMIALIFNLEKLSRVILPWAFVGALLSFIVVDMSYQFPHFRFIHYFFVHLGFLIGNIFFLITNETKYSYKDVLRSSYVLICLSTAILIYNFIFTTNHMFLNRLPDAFDFLNDSLPWYINTIGLVLIIFLLFNLFYLIYMLFIKISKIKRKNQEIF